MRPARMPSRWVKLLPWYYTERKQPSRATELASAVDADQRAWLDYQERRADD